MVDKPFSRYIRLRDSERVDDRWVGKCITCNKTGLVAWIDENDNIRFVKGWDAGHFISRGVHQLRFDEENVNLQCSFHCNKMKSGNLEKYKPALDFKYGDGTWEKLSKLAQQDGSHKLFTKAEYLQMNEDSKQQIKWYLGE